MEYIREELNTPVTNECDVLVVGGGVAGIAAALAAARHGARVILCERGFLLGGLATAGLVTIYLPLCDGFGRQVSFGLAEELLRLSIRDEKIPTRGVPNWIDSSDPAGRTEKTPRFEVDFNPQFFAIAAEEALVDAGVRILYGTTVVAALTENSRIKTVMTENKSGRQAISVSSCVDASGDCDLAVYAGAPVYDRGGNNMLAAWYYFLQNGQNRLQMLGQADIPDEDRNEKDPVTPLGGRSFDGSNALDLSDFMVLSHRELKKHLRAKEAAAGKPVSLTGIATIPQVRMTRHLIGKYTPDATEMHREFPDSVGLVSDWRKRGPVYEVPFRCLYSASVKNLACAGRCVSADGNMWDILRVIPCCAVTGQAAGTAAALSDDFTTLDMTRLQKALRQDGVVLHEGDL